jgi:hypothetical protein
MLLVCVLTGNLANIGCVVRRLIGNDRVSFNLIVNACLYAM